MFLKQVTFGVLLLYSLQCFSQETLQTVTTAGSTTDHRISINNALQQGVITTPDSSSSSNYLAQYAFTTVNGATNNIASYMLLRTQGAYWYNGPSGLGFYNKGAFSRPIMEVISGNFGNFSGYLPNNSAVRNNFLYQFIACLTNYRSTNNLITDTATEVLYGIYKNRKFYVNKGLMIGTTISDPNYMLQVNGNISARKLTITQSGWPDYVFAPTYKLPQLSELEAYVKQNHHLPGLPSTEEVKDSGIDIGAIMTEQMKKIEELTVYMINQNKIIQKQEEEIAKLDILVQNLKKTGTK